MPSLIDSHAHLTSDAVYEEIDEILQRAQEADIESIVNICTDPITLERGLALHKKYPWVHNAAATTPHDAAKEGEQVFPLIEKQAREGTLVAVGESGLDYYYYRDTAEEQKKLLRRYFQLALACSLPIIIHCRDAFEDLFFLLDEEYKMNEEWGPGVLHCFTGTLQEAEEVLKRGWYLSLSGIVTFKRSEELREVARITPLDQLLIETDTPYLAPQSKRGKRNEPSYLPEIARLIADVKDIPVQQVVARTASNARHFFQL